MSTRILVTSRGLVDGPGDDAIVAAFRDCTQDGFWLDITAPSASDYALLEHALGFHRLTIEDIQQQDQRPKVEDYATYNFVVLFGARCEADGLAFLEHHIYAAPHYCVSVRHQPDAAVDQLFVRLRKGDSGDGTMDKPPTYAYLVMDHVVDGLFEVLHTIDDEVDALIDSIIEGQSQGKIAAISRYKHQVSELRRILGAQQDVFQRLVSRVVSSGKVELSHYYRDVYDHVIRQYDMVDSLRDLLSGAMDVYLSSVSNRLNATVKALTVIASLFLPLTFLTGFFGMNFATLVATITAPWTLVIGAGLMVLSVVAQLVLFRRRGWI